MFILVAFTTSLPEFWGDLIKGASSGLWHFEEGEDEEEDEQHSKYNKDVGTSEFLQWKAKLVRRMSLEYIDLLIFKLTS